MVEVVEEHHTAPLSQQPVVLAEEERRSPVNKLRHQVKQGKVLLEVLETLHQVELGV